MKNLIIKLLALGLPIVLFLAVYEVRASHGHLNEYAAKRALFLQQAPRIRVLVLGSSHSYYGVMPEELGSNVFNLSAVSQSLYYDHALLVKYLDQMPELKVVVLPISYFTLPYQLDDGIEVWRGYDYFYFYGLWHRHWKGEISARNYLAFYLYDDQVIKPMDVLLGKAKDVIGDFDEWGGWTNRVYTKTEKPQTLAEMAQVALKRHHSYMRAEHVTENLPILEDTVKILQARGIKLVLLSTPVTSYYRAGVDPAKYQQMQEILQKVSQEPGVTYFNYMADQRFVDADFHDADHLNQQGADKFSPILKVEAVDPALGQ